LDFEVISAVTWSLWRIWCRLWRSSVWVRKKFADVCEDFVVILGMSYKNCRNLLSEGDGTSIIWSKNKVSFRQNLNLKEGGFAVKKKRFSVEQIVAILKQAELGIPIAELIRQVGVSEQTFYRWKKKYSGLEVDQLRQMKQLQEENTRLKRIVADLTLDKAMLQDVLRKKF